MRAIAIILLLGAASINAQADPLGMICHEGAGASWSEAGPDGFGHGKMFERVADRLDLTPEQRDTVEQIRSRYRDERIALADQHREALCALRDADPTAESYARQTAEASAAASRLAGDMVTLMSQMRTELHAVLTEAQRQAWTELKAEMAERFAERGDRRGRRFKHR